MSVRDDTYLGGPEFEVRVADLADGGSLVTVAGELDMATAGEFERVLRARLATGPVRLDLEPLQFMDSTGVRALDALVREMERGAFSFAVAPGLQDSVRQILEMTGMMWVLPFEDGRKEQG